MGNVVFLWSLSLRSEPSVKKSRLDFLLWKLVRSGGTIASANYVQTDRQPVYTCALCLAGTGSVHSCCVTGGRGAKIEDSGSVLVLFFKFGKQPAAVGQMLVNLRLL